jgi:hypothetical protein
MVLAGLRQLFQPSFTSRETFGVTGDDALPFVRELCIANFATVVVGTASLAVPGFVLPIAILPKIEGLKRRLPDRYRAIPVLVGAAVPRSSGSRTRARQISDFPDFAFTDHVKFDVD